MHLNDAIDRRFRVDICPGLIFYVRQRTPKFAKPLNNF